MYETPVTRPPVPWVLIGVLVLLGGGSAYIVRNVLSDNSRAERSHIAAVTLVRPQVKPPVKPLPSVPVKEKTAVTERVLKVEESGDRVMRVEGPAPRNVAPRDRASAESARGSYGDGGGSESSDVPAGDTLGVDADGGAGGDSFGLVGRKGGRSLLARAGGPHSAATVPLRSRFAGYIQIVTVEVKEKVMKRLNEEGGIPDGKLQCIVRVRVDRDGKVMDYRITTLSGNDRMDQAVVNALRSCQFSEPPPEHMPKLMDIMITSHGQHKTE